MVFDLKLLNIKNTLNILGMKFSINGKLKGKPRSSTNFIKEGNLPLQSFNKEIDFAKIHSYTLMGAFGLKLWVLKKN
jgi:small subunit ribosomal protein S3